jgi:hypothetical protein
MKNNFNTSRCGSFIIGPYLYCWSILILKDIRTRNTVAHTCNPSYLGDSDMRIWFQDKSRKNLVRPCLKEQVRFGGACPYFSYTRGRGRRITAWGLPKQKHKTLPEKITKAKRVWNMAQVVQHLLASVRPQVQTP